MGAELYIIIQSVIESRFALKATTRNDTGKINITVSAYAFAERKKANVNCGSKPAISRVPQAANLGHCIARYKKQCE